MISRESMAAAAVREALRLQEDACAADVPTFASVVQRIEADESALEAPRWTAAKSARLAASLAASQLRVIPRTVLPCALVMAVAAVCAACFAASGWGDAGASWWFSAFLLAGVALTAAAALSPDRADALSLAMPLGPQTVTFARLAAVLGVDALAGLAATAAFAWWGTPLEFGALVVSWLVPFGAVAGAASFVAVWTGVSWAGAVVGAILVPVAMPAAHIALDGGAAFPLVGLLAAIGPEGLIALGVALLIATVCSARRAALARMREA